MTTHFFARLTGKREVPPVNTEAFGVAEFIFSDDLTKLHYRVILKNIEKVTSCQIHLGSLLKLTLLFYICMTTGARY